MAGAIKVSEDLRRSWQAARLMPLWESVSAHKPLPPPDPALHWSWQELRPLLDCAMMLTTPDVIERRVMQLMAEPRHASDEATARTLTAAIQMLLPGERARPHRHTMSALRFVLEGSGATTFVDGKPCLMEECDLILTPAWTWHEHAHEGEQPVIWLDVLDVPLHAWLGTVVFQPGPVNDTPRILPDASFLAANILPVIEGYDCAHSPVFRYPYAAVGAAVAAAPAASDGSRRVRYVNPLNGGVAMPLVDVTMLHLDKGCPTARARTNANAVCCVVEGEGCSNIGDAIIRWGPRDIFTLPQHNWISHTAESSTARILTASDRDAMRRLGVLREEIQETAI